MENANDNKRVLIAGGGIAGLTLALTLHQIGIQCVVYESARQIQALGVGINIQPNAVRELFELGIGPAALDQVGIQAQEWALVGLNGHDIYAEPRGLKAGYQWPQYAAHRGKLHVLLFDKVIERLGASSVRLGQRITGYEKHANGTVSAIVEHANGDITREQGDLLIGADGIHSLVRAQMHPGQPPIHWAELSCGAAPPWQNRYARDRALWGWGRTSTAWSFIRFLSPTAMVLRRSTGLRNAPSTTLQNGRKAAGSNP